MGTFFVAAKTPSVTRLRRDPPTGRCAAFASAHPHAFRMEKDENENQ
jgi:hypothetical protein